MAKEMRAQTPTSSREQGGHSTAMVDVWGRAGSSWRPAGRRDRLSSQPEALGGFYGSAWTNGQQRLGAEQGWPGSCSPVP